jgi:nicotinamidase-related amidase
MKKSQETLYGNVPEKSSFVLLLIDVINDFAFPESDQLLRNAIPAARSLSKLKARAKKENVPVVYVNDNFGRWRSDFKSHVHHCLNEGVVGKPIVELLKPDSEDYFVLKPAHSGFYSTTLELLLKHFQARSLIITGIATNICVLFTAIDAHLRGYEIFVPHDCVAASRADYDPSIYINGISQPSRVRLNRIQRFRRVSIGIPNLLLRSTKQVLKRLQSV